MSELSEMGWMAKAGGLVCVIEKLDARLYDPAATLTPENRARMEKLLALAEAQFDTAMDHLERQAA